MLGTDISVHCTRLWCACRLRRCWQPSYIFLRGLRRSVWPEGTGVKLKRTVCPAEPEGCYSTLAALASRPMGPPRPRNVGGRTARRLGRVVVRRASSDLPAPRVTSGRLAERPHAPRVPSGIGRNLVFKDPTPATTGALWPAVTSGYVIPRTWGSVTARGLSKWPTG